MSFANYAAGAIIMPYGKFLRAAEEHRYNLDRLTAQFGANVEQVAHRLTTLSRSGAAYGSAMRSFHCSCGEPAALAASTRMAAQSAISAS